MIHVLMCKEQQQMIHLLTYFNNNICLIWSNFIYCLFIIYFYA